MGGSDRRPLPEQDQPLLLTKLEAADSELPYYGVPRPASLEVASSVLLLPVLYLITCTMWAIAPKDYRENPEPRNRSVISLFSGYLPPYPISSMRLRGGVRTP
ncbi:hypothetical protein NDU88_009825 [Pleurodeles waltl]|uniref:Uncharacterized protein n=1 Tax=Pleurodeles waltl TaxID=8319 RepID=A0AAV7RYQ6_PLEWA|nr:hypothetical protein NDU88_009825 [Pleurodeles waltl]